MSSIVQGTVKGKLADSTAKTPLSFATVTIFKAADTAIITYCRMAPLKRKWAEEMRCFSFSIYFFK